MYIWNPRKPEAKAFMASCHDLRNMREGWNASPVKHSYHLGGSQTFARTNQLLSDDDDSILAMTTAVYLKKKQTYTNMALLPPTSLDPHSLVAKIYYNCILLGVFFPSCFHTHTNLLAFWVLYISFISFFPLWLWGTTPVCVGVCSSSIHEAL